MKVSFFETARYQASKPLPSEWPVPSGVYDPDAGARAYRGMIERLEFVEELGFDWVSVSEHHYSPRILTPSPIVSAAFLAARLHATRPQIVFRFGQAVGMLPLTGTTDPEHMTQDLASRDLAPSADEVRAIESLAG